MMTTGRIPLIIWRNALLTLLFAALAAYFQHAGTGPAAWAALGMSGALWAHSGRSRAPGGAATSLLLPLACAAALSSACQVEGLPRVEVRWPEGRSAPACSVPLLRERLDVLFLPQSGIGADYVQMTPQASNPIAAGLAGVWASSSTNRVRFTDTSGGVLEAGEARKITQSAGAPGSPSEGDFWYDTVAHAVVYRDNSTNQSFPSAGNVCTLNTSQTITGAKVINANLSTTDNSYSVGDATHRFQFMGLIEMRSGTSSGLITTNVADGATAKGVIINQAGAMVTAGAEIVDFQLGGTSKAGIHYDGSFIGPKAGTVATALHAFPTGTGDLCSIDATQTLSGKTLTSPTINSPTFGANSVILDTIHGATANALGAATVYLGGIGVATGSTEYPLHIVRRAGTIRNLYCYLATAPGGADSATFTVRKNAADQATLCPISAAGQTCNDTADTFTVVAGDRISIKAVSTAGTAAGASCTVEESN